MRSLNYEKMMRQALQGVILNALRQTAQKGLPGNHHFYISFLTQFPGVIMPDWLKDQYPDYLTIVLEHEFYDLAVMEDRFSVSLSFSDELVPLVIPIDAVITFADPSAEFGLKFDKIADNSHSQAPSPPPPSSNADASEIISLDSFRKNPKKE